MRISQPLTAGQITAALGPYQAYVPTWTATGTAPGIGNAFVVGRFLQIGKFVHAYGGIQFFTTTTFGTGNYSFALPVPAVSTSQVFSAAAGFLVHGSNVGIATVTFPNVNTMQLQAGATYFGAGVLIGQLFPWTWASADIVSWNITYEAA